MANAVEKALNRANPEQKARNEEVIREAKQDIKLVAGKDVAPQSNEQKIAEARQNIPIDTMKDTNSVSHQTTPPTTQPKPYGLDMKPNPETQANIESISRAQGNKDMTQNAVDRAKERQPKEPQKVQPKQERER